MATITRTVISRPTTPKATENAPTNRIVLASLPMTVFCSWVNSYCGEDDMATLLYGWGHEAGSHICLTQPGVELIGNRDLRHITPATNILNNIDADNIR